MYGISKNCIVILFLFLSLNTSTYSQDDLSKPILYVFLSDECIITQYYVPSLNDIWVQYGEDVDMVAIFPNFSSKTKKIQSFYDKYKLKIPHFPTFLIRKDTCEIHVPNPAIICSRN